MKSSTWRGLLPVGSGRINFGLRVMARASHPRVISGSSQPKTSGSYDDSPCALHCTGHAYDANPAECLSLYSIDDATSETFEVFGGKARPAHRGGHTRRVTMLWTVSALVHAAASSGHVLAQARKRDEKQAKAKSVPPLYMLGRGGDGLPPGVADMRAAIIEAIETGDIAELKGAMDLNELPPEVGAARGTDPIEHLRSLSADRTGKDVLDALHRLLEGTWVAVPAGRDAENNRIFVWPQFAEVGVEALNEAEAKALVDLVGSPEAAAITQARRYRGWRLSIGADGVWHMLVRVGF